MNLYRCSCNRTYAGQQAPTVCRWCGGKAIVQTYTAEPPFDVLAYLKDVREHPHKYGSLAKLALGVDKLRRKRKAA